MVVHLAGCTEVRHTLVNAASPEYPTTDASQNLSPIIDGLDGEREHIAVQLVAAASGFSRITDLQTVPGDPNRMVVLEQDGKAHWLNLENGTSSPMLTVETETRSEQGLIGFAFHPGYPNDPRIYTHTVPHIDGQDVSRISEWRVDVTTGLAQNERVVMDVDQPYGNHNAGQLVFGPDGLLYIGMGDGGWKNDPHGHGQNTATLLGSILRIDVTPSADKPYTIPPSNPFVAKPEAKDELFAIGLRNPWRLTFTESGQLVVADVGQDTLEEVSIVPIGANMGWNIREANICFEPSEGCPTQGLTDPIYAYGREDGMSITGGYVWTKPGSPLSDLYLFGDFVTGRLWAMPIPAQPATATQARSLGRFSVLISTFGRTSDGKLLLADYGSGTIYWVAPD